MAATSDDVGCRCNDLNPSAARTIDCGPTATCCHGIGGVARTVADTRQTGPPQRADLLSRAQEQEKRRNGSGTVSVSAAYRRPIQAMELGIVPDEAGYLVTGLDLMTGKELPVSWSLQRAPRSLSLPRGLDGRYPRSGAVVNFDVNWDGAAGHPIAPIAVSQAGPPSLPAVSADEPSLIQRSSASRTGGTAKTTRTASP
jgi:hypothetical protein